MHELELIATHFERLHRQRGTAVLATVVGTSGSTYRRPGARMLAGDDGQVSGSLSGGCLERDIVRRAIRVMQTGEAALISYDSSDDLEEGHALGCGGVVEILLQRVEDDGAPVLFLRDCLRARQVGVAAIIVDVDGVGACRGGSVLLHPDERTEVRGIEDPILVERISAAAIDARQRRERSGAVFDGRRGRAAVFVDVVVPRPKLVICGGGHDAVPLAALAKGRGWHVAVADRRPGHAVRTRFAAVDELASDPAGASLIDEHTAVVVMHHNYFEDLNALRSVLSAPAQYVGVLGPRFRTERMLRDLAAEGVALTALQSSRLHAPAGLDIGADAPADVAMAIMVEAMAVMAGRQAGFCRDRRGPLHERSDTTPPLGALLATTQRRCRSRRASVPGAP